MAQRGQSCWQPHWIPTLTFFTPRPDSTSEDRREGSLESAERTTWSAPAGGGGPENDTVLSMVLAHSKGSRDVGSLGGLDNL